MNLTVFAGILLAVTMVTAKRANLVEKKMNKRMKLDAVLIPDQPTGGLVEKKKQAAAEADERVVALREAARPASLVEKEMNKRMKLENPECTRKMQQAGECRIDSNGKVLYLGFERMNKRMKLENPECTRKMQQAGECRIDSNGKVLYLGFERI